MSKLHSIDRAVQILRAGGLVAFPTETVYGLGADATSSPAVERIFAAKGRPATNPVIAHVADVMVARRYAAEWPESAGALARAFWPGPLTLVLPRRPGGIADTAAAGLPSVGLRAPDHPLALALLRAFDGPVAAPSANRSTRVSPTTAAHVRDEFGGQVDLILCGGPCRVGIESTVIDLTAAQPTILRPGGVTREQIERVIGPVRLFAGSVSADRAALSPGQQEVHYAPVTPAFRFEQENIPGLRAWVRTRSGESLALLCLAGSDDPAQSADAVGPALRTGLLSIDQSAGSESVRSADPTGTPTAARLNFVDMPALPGDYAASLYATLRDWDARGVGAIVVEMPPDEPAWLAIRDRLRRATRAI